MFKDGAGGKVIDEFVGLRANLYSYKMFEGEESKKCKGVNPFPNKPWFLRVCSTNLLKTLWENTVGKGEISHSVFYQYGELSAIFIKLEIVV